MIGSKFSRHCFHQSEVKPKLIVARACTFSRALFRLRVITSSFDWFTGLSPSFLIGQRNYLGFGFRHSFENRSNLKRLESLTICRCDFKGSTFSSVILSPRFAPTGVEPKTCRTLVLCSTSGTKRRSYPTFNGRRRHRHTTINVQRLTFVTSQDRLVVCLLLTVNI